jgi:hypothetical protein
MMNQGSGGANVNDSAFLSMIKVVVEQHGCRIVDIDLETHTINLDGPEDAVSECAIALSTILD